MPNAASVTSRGSVVSATVKSVSTSIRSADSSFSGTPPGVRSQNALPTMPCASAYTPVTSVTWFGFVRAGMTARAVSTLLRPGSLATAAISAGSRSGVAKRAPSPSTTTR